MKTLRIISWIPAFLVMAFFHSCKDKGNVELRFELPSSYDRMQVVLTDVNESIKVELSSESDFTYNLKYVGVSSYTLQMAAFKNSSDDTLSFYKTTIQTSEHSFNTVFSFLEPDQFKIEQTEAGFDSVNIVGSWSNIPFDQNMQLYISADSIDVFSDKNVVSLDGSSYLAPNVSNDQFLGLKRTENINEFTSRYVKSEIVKLGPDLRLFNYAKPDEWIYVDVQEFADYKYRFLVEKGKWYLLEGYDKYNSDETATELIVLPGSHGGYCTREPDGHSFFIMAKSDTIEAFATISFVTGTLGSFKLRLTSLAQANPSQIEGDHEFEYSNQVKYASQFFPAGEHTLSMSQNEIETDAYVYYTILKDNDYLQVEENTVLKPAHDLGPNFRGDSATQIHTFTLTQPTTLQMIMVAGFHGKPDVLTVIHE